MGAPCSSAVQKEVITTGNNVNLQINSRVEVDGEEEFTSTRSVDGQNCSSGVSMRERLSSPALWAAVLGLLGLVLEAAGVFEKLGITGENRDAVITAVGAVLSAFGIINNPTDRHAL